MTGSASRLTYAMGVVWKSRLGPAAWSSKIWAYNIFLYDLSFFASFFLCTAESSLILGGGISKYCLECVHVCKVLKIRWPHYGSGSGSGSGSGIIVFEAQLGAQLEAQLGAQRTSKHVNTAQSEVKLAQYSSAQLSSKQVNAAQ